MRDCHDEVGDEFDEHGSKTDGNRKADENKECVKFFVIPFHKYLSFYIYFITISMQVIPYVKKKKEQAHRPALKKRNVLNIILIIYLLYTPLDALCASIF